MKEGNKNTTSKVHNLPSSMQEMAKTAAASINPKGIKSAIQQYKAAFYTIENNPSPTSDKQKGNDGRFYFDRKWPGLHNSNKQEKRRTVRAAAGK